MLDDGWKTLTLILAECTNESTGSDINQNLSPSPLEPKPLVEMDWDNLPEFEVLTVDESNDDLEEFFEKSDSKESIDWEDLPGLDPLSDDSDDEEDTMQYHSTYVSEEESAFVEQIQTVLMQCQPFPGSPVNSSYNEGGR